MFAAFFMPVTQVLPPAMPTLMMIMEIFIKEENEVMRTESVTLEPSPGIAVPSEKNTTAFLPLSTIQNVIASPSLHEKEHHYDALVRPKAISQQLEYLPPCDPWPVRLLLSAGTGLPLTNRPRGTGARTTAQYG